MPFDNSIEPNPVGEVFHTDCRIFHKLPRDEFHLHQGLDVDNKKQNRIVVTNTWCDTYTNTKWPNLIFVECSVVIDLRVNPFE